MLGATADPSDLEAVVQQVAVELLATHRSHLRELLIQVVEGGLVIRGRVVSFYGKQLAFHEVSRRCGRTVLANQVEVQPPPTE
jgi:hypothetical protein